MYTSFISSLSSGQGLSSANFTHSSTLLAILASITFSSSNSCGTTTECLFFCNGCVNPYIVVHPPQASLSVFPNPSATTLTVQVSDSVQSNSLDQPYQLQLMDKSGTKVTSIQSSEKVLDIPVGHLPPGIYYLKLIYKDAVLQKKVIINR